MTDAFQIVPDGENFVAKIASGVDLDPFLPGTSNGQGGADFKVVKRLSDGSTVNQPIRVDVRPSDELATEEHSFVPLSGNDSPDDFSAVLSGGPDVSVASVELVGPDGARTDITSAFSFSRSDSGAPSMRLSAPIDFDAFAGTDATNFYPQYSLVVKKSVNPAPGQTAKTVEQKSTVVTSPLSNDVLKTAIDSMISNGATEEQVLSTLKFYHIPPVQVDAARSLAYGTTQVSLQSVQAADWYGKFTEKNFLPVFSGLPRDIRLVPGVQMTPVVLPAATDANPRDTVSYAVSGLPNGVSFNASARTLSGKPTAAGRYAAIYSATDGKGTVSETFVFIVNTPPAFASVQPAVEYAAGASVSLTLPAATDADTGTTLTYSASGLPSGLSFNASTRTVSGTLPSPSSAQVSTVTYSVTDGIETVSQTFGLTVKAKTTEPQPETNNAPTASGIPGTISMTEDVASSVVNFTVADDKTAVGSLTVTASSSNTALIANSGIALGGTGANRTLQLTPVANANGVAIVTVVVSDGSKTSSYAISVTVNAMNDAPTFSSTQSNFSLTQGVAMSAVTLPAATDVDTGDTLTYSIVSGLPTGLSFNSATRQITGTPTVSGTFLVSYRATDSFAGNSTQTFTITVDAADSVPNAFAFADQTNVARSTVVTSAPITVAGTNVSSAISIAGGEYQINGTGSWFSTPGTVYAGDTVRVRHTSSANPVTVTNTTLTIGGISDTFSSTTVANAAPTLSSISDQSVAKNASTGAIAFTVGDTETAAASLSVSATSSNTTLLPNANIVFGGSGTSRTVSLTPAAAQAGTTTVTLTVSDADGGSTSQTFTLTVTGTPPELGDVPNQTAVVGTAFSLALAGYVTASNGDAVDSYRISSGSLPAGLSLNTSTGAVSGTPTSAGSATVSFQAHDADGWSNADSVTFTVNAPANAAPTLSDVSNQSTGRNTSVVVAVTVGDAETAAASLSVSATSSNTSLVPNGNLVWGGSGANRTLTVTPANDQIGTVTITYSDSDGTDTTTKTFNVTFTNAAPVFVSTQSNFSLTQNAAMSAVTLPAATDADAGDTVTYSIVSGLPAGLSFNTGTRQITGTPTATGTSTVTYRATDESNVTVDQTFTITVNAPANTAPSVSNAVGPDAGGNVNNNTIASGNQFDVTDAEGGNVTVTVATNHGGKIWILDSLGNQVGTGGGTSSASYTASTSAGVPTTIFYDYQAPADVTAQLAGGTAFETISATVTDSSSAASSQDVGYGIYE